MPVQINAQDIIDDLAFQLMEKSKQIAFLRAENKAQTEEIASLNRALEYEKSDHSNEPFGNFPVEDLVVPVPQPVPMEPEG